MTSSTTVTITLQTSLGDITAELYPDKAPVTVNHFMATVAAGIYKQSRFHRSAASDDNVPGKNYGIAVIEAGPRAGEQSLPAISHETTLQTGLLNQRGVLAMSRDEPGTASSGFFINVADNPTLDSQEACEGKAAVAGYATFGRVTGGMAVVDAIHRQPTGQKIVPAEEKAFFALFKDKNPAVAQWYLNQQLNTPIEIKAVVVGTGD